MHRQQISSRSKNTSRFRLNCKNLYLTFPKCDTPKETLLNNIVNHFAHDLLTACVCQEQHQDGSNHLHALIRLSKKIDYRTPHYLDALVVPPKHGNYQSCRSWSDVLVYICKDNNYVSHNWDVVVELEKIKRKRKPIFTLIGEQIFKKQKTVYQIAEENPGFFLQHQSKVVAMATYVNNLQTDFKKEWWGVRPVDPTHNFGSFLIAEWLMRNMGVERPHKQKQLWIVGKTNMRKTSLCVELEKFFKTFWMPYEDKWCEGYSDEYELCVLDEFSGQKTITFLNNFVEGSPFTIPNKFGSGIKKRKNVPVIVLSNMWPHEVYHKAAEKNKIQFTAFKERFEIVDLDQPIEIVFTLPLEAITKDNAFATKQDFGMPLIVLDEDGEVVPEPLDHPVLQRQTAMLSKDVKDMEERLTCHEIFEPLVMSDEDFDSVHRSLMQEDDNSLLEDSADEEDSHDLNNPPNYESDADDEDGSDYTGRIF